MVLRDNGKPRGGGRMDGQIDHHFLGGIVIAVAWAKAAGRRVLWALNRLLGLRVWRVRILSRSWWVVMECSSCHVQQPMHQTDTPILPMGMLPVGDPCRGCPDVRGDPQCVGGQPVRTWGAPTSDRFTDRQGM
ncbi:Uncharacterised protein [Mycobacteroides abscessus subsp. abscessus]|nr:Uncharacterised protein [Mycobacteroides abscessus subsp. abscessus]